MADITAEKIGVEDIEFGTGTFTRKSRLGPGNATLNQVSAADIPIADAGGLYSAADVEAALAEVMADVDTAESDIDSAEADIATLQATTLNGLTLSLTNKTGSTLNANDLVRVDGSNASAVAAITEDEDAEYVVATETIANNASGTFRRVGSITCEVDGSGSIGDYAYASGTANKAKARSTKETGAFGIFLTAPSAGTATLLLLGKTQSNPVLRGFIDGFQCSEGTDASHDIDVGEGVLLDVGETRYLSMSALAGKKGDAAWAEGANLGADASGSGMAADTKYYGFIISKDADDKATLDFMIDTSSTGANVPTGWTVERRIWFGYSGGGSSWIGWFQRGNRIYYKDPPLDINQTTTPITRTLHTLRVPAISGVIAMVNINLDGGTEVVSFQCPDMDDEAATWAVAPLGLRVAVGAAQLYAEIPVNSSGQIAVRADGTGADVFLSVVGWIDPRGRNE